MTHKLNNDNLIQQKYEEFMEVMKFFKMIPDTSGSNHYNESNNST